MRPKEEEKEENTKIKSIKQRKVQYKEDKYFTINGNMRQ